MARVVVTGLGVVSPLGVGVPEVWTRLLAAQTGVRETTAHSQPRIASLSSCLKTAAIVPSKKDDLSGFDFEEKSLVNSPRRPSPAQRQMPLCTQFALKAAEEALKDAGFTENALESRRKGEDVDFRFGTAVGSGIGALDAILELNRVGARCSPWLRHSLKLP